MISTVFFVSSEFQAETRDPEVNQQDNPKCLHLSKIEWDRIPIGPPISCDRAIRYSGFCLGVRTVPWVLLEIS